jgi:hypothetical protein
VNAIVEYGDWIRPLRSNGQRFARALDDGPEKTRAHMHVGSDIHVGDRWFGKVHLPTGVVGLERVVALAIAELGAKPLRDDWERLIGEAAVR